MKYRNRKSLAIELYLASQSALFSRHNELSPDELISRLRIQSYSVRSQVAAQIRESVTELINKKNDVADLIPQRVAELSTDLCNANRIHRMRPFFKWLGEIQRENDFARTNWMRQLRSVSASMGSTISEFFGTFCTGNNQRVYLEERDGVVVMSLGERSWGKLEVMFPDCKVQDGTLPIIAFVFLMEIDNGSEEGRYSFELLLDTDFGSDEYPARALRANGWHTVKFESACPIFRLRPCNYAQEMRLTGPSRGERVFECSNVLLEKAQTVSESALTAEERQVLPIATFFYCSGKLQTEPKKGNPIVERALVSLFENRYTMQRVADFFKEENIPSISSAIDKVLEYSENDMIREALQASIRFFEIINEETSAGNTRKLLYRLENMIFKAFEAGQQGAGALCDIGEDMSKSAGTIALPEDALRSQYQARQFAVAHLATLLDERLHEMKYEGTFPDYRRIRHGYAQYITVCETGNPHFYPNADMEFSFSLCLGKTRISRKEKKSGEIRGVPYEHTSAGDSKHETCRHSRFGVMDFLPQTKEATVKVNVLTGEVSVPHPEAFDALLRLAKKFMRGANLTRAQRKERKKYQKDTDAPVRRPFWDKFIKIAPKCNLLCPVLLVVYFILRSLSDTVAALDLRIVALIVALSGIITAAAAAGIYCLRRYKKLWKY